MTTPVRLHAARLAAIAVLGVIALLPAVANACSTTPGYIRPSNFELLQIADAVVLATPTNDQHPQASDAGDFPSVPVRFRVTEVLKGQIAGEVIDVAMLRLGRTRPSDPSDIRFSHPEGHAGPCNRMTVSRSGSYVLFLQERDGLFAPLGYPFSRVSEDYAGEDSPWMQALRTYLKVQRLEPMAQLDELARLKDSLDQRLAASRYERVLAADIGDHLGSISPWKPTAFLLDAYDRAKAGKPQRFPPRGAAIDAEQSEAEALTGAILAELGREEPKPPSLQAMIVEALVNGSHPGAAPLFEAGAGPDAAAGQLAVAIRFLTNSGQYERAYALIEQRAPALFASGTSSEVSQLAWAINEVQDDYEPGAGRWRSSPAASERWPALALRLITIQQARFGQADGYRGAVAGLLTSDYRANPALSLIISGDDNRITDWALAELDRLGVLGSAADEALLELPLRIHLKWYGLSGEDEDLPPLERLFCAGGPSRDILLRVWGEEGSGNSMSLALRMAASRAMHDDGRTALKQAVLVWDRRYVAERRESWLAADKAARKMSRGEPLTASDIKPLKPTTCPAS